MSKSSRTITVTNFKLKGLSIYGHYIGYDFQLPRSQVIRMDINHDTKKGTVTIPAWLYKDRFEK